MKKGKNSDYCYLSNRKMIEVVFPPRVSLLAFYSSEKVLSAQAKFAHSHALASVL